MVFSSLLFLFAFLAIQLIVYYSMRTMKAKNICLLVFSLIFYAWGGPAYLLLLMGESWVSFVTAREIEKSAFKKMKKRWLMLEITTLLGLLLFFKYTGFFLNNLKILTGVPEIVPEIVLPIGISFYTFQLLSYVIDVYRQEVPAQKSYYKVLLYSSLFHQCIAGPIVRYQTVAQEIEARQPGKKDLYEGIRRFSIGIAKKAILANGAAEIVDSILPELTAKQILSVSTGNLWLAMFAYMLQIYLDFSAYSDMAIGMGRMVGFHYLENFDYPYRATSVQDFWRRWHISLSSFFRDYVYIPLGGSRRGTGRTFFNMLAVWALTGFWHGASWNYILWGMYFFVFLSLERLFLKKIIEKNAVTKIFGFIYTMVVVYFGWVFFKFTDLEALWAAFRVLFGEGAQALASSTVLLNKIFFLIVAVLSCTPISKNFNQWFLKEARRQKKYNLATVSYGINALIPAILLILSALCLIGDSYNPFLYFQF